MLVTYGGFDCNDIVAYESKENKQTTLSTPLSPGDLVRHVSYDDTRGVVVAQREDYLLILWSRPPDGMTVLEKSMAQQALDEIDAEILRDMRAGLK